MSVPVVCMRSVEKIGRIMKILNSEGSHNGFPVVDDFYPDQPEKVRIGLEGEGGRDEGLEGGRVGWREGRREEKDLGSVHY